MIVMAIFLLLTLDRSKANHHSECSYSRLNSANMSNGSNKNYIGDNYLRPDGCGPSTCTHVTKDGSNTAWISLELDYTKGDFGISTIVFLADRN